MFEETKKKEKRALSRYELKFVKILEEGKGHVRKDTQYTYTI